MIEGFVTPRGPAPLPSRMHCKLYVDSDGVHLQQLYTGFSLLARAGHITRLEHVLPKRLRDPRPRYWTLTVVIDDTIEVAYDVGDRPDIDEELLNRVDVYFKRSFIPHVVRNLVGDAAAKVHPLGLNYEVYPNHIELQGAIRNWRCQNGMRRWSGALRPLRLSPRFAPRQRYLESPPLVGAEPRIVFLTRAWDPANDEDRNEEEKRDREAVNEARANCIIALRRQFGHRVTAGFARSDYALRNFRNLVVDDVRLTQQHNYLEALRRVPICVTTTGLHSSVGWKLGEYVALSKAIVTEPLRCALPGSFRRGRNFLEFTTADECVARVEELVTNGELRSSMMMNNFHYYQSYVRPDSLVLNSLLVAMVGCTTRGSPGEGMQGAE